jgi:hypothetical protein
MYCDKHFHPHSNQYNYMKQELTIQAVKQVITNNDIQKVNYTDLTTYTVLQD